MNHQYVDLSRPKDASYSPMEEIEYVLGLWHKGCREVKGNYFTTSHISPMCLKPPFGMQPAHIFLLWPEGQFPLAGQAEQEEQMDVPLDMETRRSIPVCSRNSIFRRISSVVVPSSCASISIERDFPSFSKFNNSCITTPVKPDNDTLSPNQ